MDLTAGGAVFARLKALGVDYVFANSGTDFPPIIEGLAQAANAGVELPTAMVIPHEHAAMGMAHGYYFATGRAQAVMLHTNVGLANGVIGAINAAADHVPIIVMSGRTPTTEQGRFGSRTVPIGWGQEMRDQTALVREACKWDYELRFPEQTPAMLDRAYAIANSTPAGPVYISLPREVLCEPCPEEELSSRVTMRASVGAAAPEAIENAARVLAKAKRPIVFAQRGTRSREGFAALQRIVEQWGWPVCQYWACQLPVPSAHAMNIGSDPMPYINEADAVLVIDSLAPWMPQIHQPPATTPVIQLGPDPLESRFPVRQFASDITLATDTTAGLLALEAALEPYLDIDQSQRQQRYQSIAKEADRRRLIAAKTAQEGATTPMTKAYVAQCISNAIADTDASVLSELGAPLDSMNLSGFNGWYQEPHAGGLGWSLPCAMGMRLATPDRLIVATMGDGAYMFANPTACHQIMEAYDIAVLIVILNNERWDAVEQSTKGLYPDGHAVNADRVPLTALSPSPDFTLTARASRAHACTVTEPAQLPEALREAINVITTQGRSALLDVKIA